MTNEEQSPEAAAERGSFGRVIGAIVSPRPTFASIVRKPTWLLPLLLVLVFNVLLIFSYGRRIGWSGFIEKQLVNSSRYQQLPPAEQQQRLARTVKLAPILFYLGGTAGTVVILLVVAAIFLGAFNILFGGSVKFRQSLGITAHAFLPGMLKAMLGLLIVWVRPPEGVTLQNLVMSNVRAFLPDNVPLWLQTLGASLDLFTFWSIVLLALGFAAASSSRKVKFGTALTVVVVIWMVFVLGFVGFAAIRG